MSQFFATCPRRVYDALATLQGGKVTPPAGTAVGLSVRRLRLFAAAALRIWLRRTGRKPPTADHELGLHVAAVAEAMADDGLPAALRPPGRKYLEPVRLPLANSAYQAALWNGPAFPGLVRDNICMAGDNPAVAQALRDAAGCPFVPVTLASLGRPDCGRCGGAGTDAPPDRSRARAQRWLVAWPCPDCSPVTPTVRALAAAAYGTRRHKVVCRSCSGEGCSAHGAAHGGCDGSGRRWVDDCLDPDTLAVTADALEEAGCTEVRLLNELRGLKVCPACAGTGRKSQEVAGGATPVACDRCIPVRRGWRDSSPISAPGWIWRDQDYFRGFWAIDTILGFP